MTHVFIVLTTLVATLNAQAITFDFSQPATISQFRAIAADGYANVTMRALAPTGTFDMNFCTNAMHAVLAQVGSSIYAIPNPLIDAKLQVHNLNDGLYKCNIFYRSYWLEVMNPSKWKDVNTNIQFILDFLTESNKIYHQDVGIFTTQQDWDAITGGANITEISDLYHPLWYRGSTPDENFNDFKSFGGWITPAMKQMEPIVVEQISGFRNLYAHNW